MIEKTLNSLGLTEYERKGYLHLVRNGTMGAVELAKKSGVPFGRIYDVLYLLESKGFVKVVLTQPKQFSPIPPKAALSSALKRLKEEYTSVEQEVSQDMDALEKEYLNQEELKKPTIWMVTGDRNVHEVRRRELTEAKHTINGIISPDVSTGYAPGIEGNAREAEERGVKRRFIENPLTKSDRDKIRDKVEGGALVKVFPYTGFTLTIRDSMTVRIEVKDPQHGNSSVIIENPALAKAMDEFFLYRWGTARKL